jgi:hypothetical protein
VSQRRYDKIKNRGFIRKRPIVTLKLTILTTECRSAYINIHSNGENCPQNCTFMKTFVLGFLNLTFTNNPVNGTDPSPTFCIYLKNLFSTLPFLQSFSWCMLNPNKQPQLHSFIFRCIVTPYTRLSTLRILGLLNFWYIPQC